MRDAVKNLPRGCAGIHLLRLEPARDTDPRSAACPASGHAGSGAASGQEPHSSSTNLALNMVRTMSAITCPQGDALTARRASLRASWVQEPSRCASIARARDRDRERVAADLAGLFGRDLLGNQALLKDVHHLPAKVDHRQRHPEERHLATTRCDECRAQSRFARAEEVRKPLHPFRVTPPLPVKWRSSRSNNSATRATIYKRFCVCESPRDKLCHK